MTAMQIVGLVLSSLVGFVVLFAIVWFPISRRLAGLQAELAKSVEAAGEKPERGPERASYRGASAGFTKVKGLGVVVLTPRTLIFRPVLGQQIEVPRDQVVEVREDKWFLRSYAGRVHTIIKTRSGAEVGFFFSDPAGWSAALKRTTAAA